LPLTGINADAETVQQELMEWDGFRHMMISLANYGEEYERHWEDIVHSGADLPPSQALAFKREWLAWGKECMRVNSIANLPADQLIEAIRKSQQA